MREPLVSVVLPTHDRPVWLAEALRGVLSGEFENLEVVVSNNGRPEHTRRLAGEITDPRVHWVESPGAVGALANLRAALEPARGRYVAVLHDDDRWAPGFLAALVPPLLARPDAVLAFCDHHMIDAAGRVDAGLTERVSARFGRTGLARGYHQPFFDVAARQSVAVTGCVFRRDALPVSALSTEFGSVYDIWMMYRLAATCGVAYFHDQRLMYYRAHQGSLTASGDVTGPLAAIRCREEMLADPRMRPYRTQLRKWLGRDHLTAGASLLRRGERDAARTHLLAAIRSWPSWKAAGGLVASMLAPNSVLGRL